MKRFSTGLAAVALLAMTPAIAAAYYVHFEYYAYATSSDGIPVRDDQTLDGWAYADGAYAKYGDFGNYGSLSFAIDLMDRAVVATGHSHGVKPDVWPHFASGTGRVESASFYDRVTFIAPAGTHPEGLFATMTGTMRGLIRSDIGAGAQARCVAELGGERHDTGLLTVGIDFDDLIVVDESFTVVTQLVAPGVTLTHDVVYFRDLYAGVWDCTAWSVDYNTGAGYVTGDGDIDFSDGVRITSLTASDGVRFSSQSGAFGDGVTPVPDARAARVLANWPNPFNPSTTISFELPGQEKVSLRVFDLSGCLVRKLIDGEVRGGGHHEVTWHGVDDRGGRCGSGTYFYRLEAGAFAETRRMVLLK